MTNPLKLAIFLFYRHYSTGPTATVAYIKTIGVMMLLVFVLILDVLVLTNLEKYLPFDPGDREKTKYLNIFLYTLPILLFLLILFPEKKIKEFEYPVLRTKKANMYLFLITAGIILSLPIILIAKYGL